VQSTVYVPENDTVDWFIDGNGGKQRRQYDLNAIAPATGTITPGFCDPSIGLKAGPLFWLKDERVSIAPAIGAAFMFGDLGRFDGNDNDYNNVSPFIEGIVNVHFTPRGAYVGAGLGWWDVFDGAHDTGAFIANFGLPMKASARGDLFFVGEGRLLRCLMASRAMPGLGRTAVHLPLSGPASMAASREARRRHRALLPRPGRSRQVAVAPHLVREELSPMPITRRMMLNHSAATLATGSSHPPTRRPPPMRCASARRASARCSPAPAHRLPHGNSTARPTSHPARAARRNTTSTPGRRHAPSTTSPRTYWHRSRLKFPSVTQQEYVA
jgi:hypothetical protein